MVRRRLEIEDHADAGMEDEPYGIFDTRSGDEDCGVAGFMILPAGDRGRDPAELDGLCRRRRRGRDGEADRGGGRIGSQGAVRRAVCRAHGGGGRPARGVLCIMTPVPMDNPPPMAPIGAPGTFGWQELYANDGREALAFYGKLFGWTLDHAMPIGEMATT